MQHPGTTARRLARVGACVALLLGGAVMAEAEPGDGTRFRQADDNAQSRPLEKRGLSPISRLPQARVRLDQPPPPQQWLDSGVAEMKLSQLALEVEVDERVLGRLRDGFGLDYLLSEGFGTHLNVRTRRNPRTTGMRWMVNADDYPDAVTMASDRWSLGCSLEEKRTWDGHRRIAVVPELVLRPAAGPRAPFQATLRYADWKSVSEKTVQDDMAAQFLIQYKF